MNIIKTIIDTLGVKLYEEFNLKYEHNDTMLSRKYRFTENGLECFFLKDGWVPSIILNEVVSGNYEIVKIPWAPKKGDTVWVWGKRKVTKYVFDYDLAFYWKLGLIFPTKEEAAVLGEKRWEEIVQECKEYLE